MVIISYTNKLPSLTKVRDILALPDGDPEKEWRIWREEYSETDERKKIG